jgi:hypothetical protein
MTIDSEQILRNTKHYTLIVTAKTSYYAAQGFAFVACQLDDLNKTLTKFAKRYES